MKHTSAWELLLHYTHVNGLPCWSLYLCNFLSLQTHQYQCPRFPVSCPNRCDPTKIPREEVEVHVQELCPSATMNCPFKEAGCKFKVSAYPILMKLRHTQTWWSSRSLFTQTWWSLRLVHTQTWWSLRSVHTQTWWSSRSGHTKSWWSSRSVHTQTRWSSRSVHTQTSWITRGRKQES